MWNSLGVYVIDLSTATVLWILQKGVLHRLAVITGSDIIFQCPSLDFELYYLVLIVREYFSIVV